MIEEKEERRKGKEAREEEKRGGQVEEGNQGWWGQMMYVLGWWGREFIAISSHRETSKRQLSGHYPCRSGTLLETLVLLNAYPSTDTVSGAIT